MFFDRPAAGGLPVVERVTVRVAAPAEDADGLIRDAIDAAPERDALVVVTSDKPLYSYAHTRGARVLRAHEWNRLTASRS